MPWKTAPDIIWHNINCKEFLIGEAYEWGSEGAERLALQLAHTQASAAGLTITIIWEDYQACQKQQAAAAASVTTPTAYEDFVTEWKRRKKAAGKSERYVDHAAADLMKFGKGQERRNIHEIMPAELDKYINSQKIQKQGKDFGKPWGLSTKRTSAIMLGGQDAEERLKAEG